MIPLPKNPASIPTTIDPAIQTFFEPIAQYCDFADLHTAHFIIPDGVVVDPDGVDVLFDSIDVNRGVAHAPKPWDGISEVKVEPLPYARWIFTY